MNGFLKFLFGFIMGIVVLVGGVVAGGYYVYKKVSINTVSDLTKTDIKIGNEDFQDLTIEQLIKLFSDIAKGEGDDEVTYGSLASKYDLRLPDKIVIGDDNKIDTTILNTWIADILAKDVQGALKTISNKLSLEYIGTTMGYIDPEEETDTTDLMRCIFTVQLVKTNVTIESETYTKRIYQHGLLENNKFYYHEGSFYNVDTNAELEISATMLVPAMVTYVDTATSLDTVEVDNYGNFTQKQNAEGQFLYTFGGEEYYYDVLKEAFFKSSDDSAFAGDPDLAIRRLSYSLSDIGGIVDGLSLLKLNDLGMDTSTIPYGMGDILADISISDLISGNLDIEDKLNDISLSEFITVDPENPDPIIDPIAELTIGDLNDPDKLNDTLKAIALADIIEGESTDVIITTLKDSDLTIGDIMDNPDALVDEFGVITIGELMGITDEETDSILLAIRDVTINQIRDESATENILITKIKTIKLADIMEGESTDVIITTLKDSDLTIGDIMDDPDALVDEFGVITIGELMGLESTETDPILVAIKDITIDQIRDDTATENILIATIKDLTLGDLMGATSDPILSVMSELKVGDIMDNPDSLTDKIDTLSVGDFIGETDDALLDSLSTLTIGDLKTEGKVREQIDGLYIADIIDVGGDTTSMIYKISQKQRTIWIIGTGDDQVEYTNASDYSGDPADLTQTTRLYKISELGELFENLVLTDIFEASELETGVLSLMDPNTQVSAMTEEIQTVIEDTTLGELREAGVVDYPSNDSINDMTINGALQMLNTCLSNPAIAALLGL